MIKKYIIILLIVIPIDSFACSFSSGYEDFVPRPNISPNNIPPKIPTAKIISITRGYDDGNRGSCSDAGIISIQFSKNNIIDQTGYKLKIILGEFNSNVIPSNIIMPTRQGKIENRVFFVWLDGSSNIQEPINFTLEVTAVSADNIESKPFVLEVKHPGGISNLIK